MSPESGSEVVRVATVESMTIFSLNAVAERLIAVGGALSAPISFHCT